MDQPTGMRIEQVIYTTEQLPASITYYGDVPDDPIPTVIYTDEKKLSILMYWLSGWRYSYTMIITNE